MVTTFPRNFADQCINRLQEFVDKVSDTFICGICSETVVEPVNLPCAHLYCMVRTFLPSPWAMASMEDDDRRSKLGNKLDANNLTLPLASLLKETVAIFSLFHVFTPSRSTVENLTLRRVSCKNCKGLSACDRFKPQPQLAVNTARPYAYFPGMGGSRFRSKGQGSEVCLSRWQKVWGSRFDLPGKLF